nr:hypothetical protein [Lactococcus lactis]
MKIGPFYILQDDFLISSESNVRNMLVGRKESERWGAPVELGYFPLNTFGNGQNATNDESGQDLQCRCTFCREYGE